MKAKTVLSLIITMATLFVCSCERVEHEQYQEESHDQYRILNHSGQTVLLKSYYIQAEIKNNEYIDISAPQWLFSDAEHSDDSVCLFYYFNELVVHKKVQHGNSTLFLPAYNNIMDTSSYIAHNNSANGIIYHHYTILPTDLQ